MEKENLTKKWLNDELNEAEKKAFSELDDVQLRRDIVENATLFKASHFSKIDGFNSFKERHDRRKKPVEKLNWTKPVLKIASVAVIAFGLYFAFQFFGPTQIETLAGEKTTFELPDNSVVMLNAKSSIEYNKARWNEKRRVKLDGEAFFKVAKGQKFEVITSSGTVTVVGTEFNVKQRSAYFEVKCFQGIVSVSSGAVQRMLLAGDTYRVLDNEFSEGKTTVASPSWTTNMSDFEAIPFKEVVAELERQYNIKVLTKNVGLNRLFTGGFVHDNLENALTSITQPMNLTFAVGSENQVVIRGKSN